MKCYFSNPVDLNLGNGTTTPDFEYSELNCTSTPIYELITNENYPDRQFYVQKTFTYGEAIVIWFLTLFAIFLISKTIYNFLWQK